MASLARSSWRSWRCSPHPPRRPSRAPPVTLDTLMAAPFPTDLVAAPVGGRLAWVASNSGVHNVWVADPPITRRAPSRATPATMGCGSPAGLGRATRRRSSTCAATARTARANRRIRHSCRTAPIKPCSPSRSRAETPKRLGPGSGPVPSPRRPARGLGRRADRSGASTSRTTESAGAPRQRTWCRVGTRRGRPTDRCSPSPAAAARTATSASFTLARKELRYIDPSLDRDGNADVVARWLAHRVDSTRRGTARADVLAAPRSRRAVVASASPT